MQFTKFSKNKRLLTAIALGLLAGSLAYALQYGRFLSRIEGVTWGRMNNALGGATGWLATTFGAPFHDFAGSVVVHAVGGWLALPAIILLGARAKRYESDSIKVSSIPFLALGSWTLIVGWFGFNVMSAGALSNISGVVAINSLMAMVGGTLAALFVSRNDAGFVHNDLKWRNLLVTNGDAPVVHLIDCPSGGFWWGPFLRYRIVKDLACLDKVAKYHLTRTQRLRFYLDYAGRDRLTGGDKRRVRRIVRFFEGRE